MCRSAARCFVLVCAVGAGTSLPACKRTVPTEGASTASAPASAPATAASSVPLPGSSAAVSPPVVTASFAPPDHWSTVSRDPQTDPLFVKHPHHPRFFVGSIESDDGAEGDLYLERDGDTLFGRWGLTVVDGTLGAGGKAFQLRDVGTGQTLFEGSLEGEALVGVIGAEGVLRRVRSLPARSLAETSFRLTHGDRNRLLTVEVQAGSVKRATFSTYGKNAKKDAPFTVRREADHLVIVGEKEEWNLWAIASGILGRSAEGRLVHAEHRSPSSEANTLPFTRGPLVIGASHLRKGRPNTKCDIDIELPTVNGIPNAADVEKSLQRSVIDAGVGMWPSGEPQPTLAAFVCQNDPTVDIQIQSADTSVTPLPGGFVGLEVKGYARFSSMGGVSASSDCLLLDATKGELVPDLLNKLPDEVAEAIRVQADRSLKRDMRSATLDRDDFYVVPSLESLSSGMSVCPSATGLRLLIPLGTITKNLAGSGPLTVDIPRRHLLPRFPAEHRFRALFAQE